MYHSLYGTKPRVLLKSYRMYRLTQHSIPHMNERQVNTQILGTGHNNYIGTRSIKTQGLGYLFKYNRSPVARCFVTERRTIEKYVNAFVIDTVFWPYFFSMGARKLVYG